MRLVDTFEDLDGGCVQGRHDHIGPSEIMPYFSEPQERSIGKHRNRKRSQIFYSVYKVTKTCVKGWFTGTGEGDYLRGRRGESQVLLKFLEDFLN
jgi:hypothetical protein